MKHILRDPVLWVYLAVAIALVTLQFALNGPVSPWPWANVAVHLGALIAVARSAAPRPAHRQPSRPRNPHLSHTR